MGCKCSLRKKLISKNLKLTKEDTYLDYCSTTKPDIEILAEAERTNRLLWGNPSSQNSRGVYLYRQIEESSFKLLKKLNIPNYFIFYDYSSSSIISHIFQNSKKIIVTSNIEHNSLSRNSHKKIPVDKDGLINIIKLSKVIDKNSIFIYSPVNHEIGTIQNSKEIYEICKKNGAQVILDSVQTISRINRDLWINYCDGFYFSGHKVHSIPGAAALILKNNFKILPPNETLPFSICKGTINSTAILSLNRSTLNLLDNFNEDLTYIKNLHNEALQILSKIKTNVIYNSDNPAPGIINISLPEIQDIEKLLLHLNDNKVYISRFSACTGDISMPSKILTNIGKDINTTRSSLRISFGKHSKRSDFFNFVNSINKHIRV